MGTHTSVSPASLIHHGCSRNIFTDTTGTNILRSGKIQNLMPDFRLYHSNLCRHNGHIPTRHKEDSSLLNHQTTGVNDGCNRAKPTPNSLVSHMHSRLFQGHAIPFLG